MIPDYSESNSYHIYHHVRKSIYEFFFLHRYSVYKNSYNRERNKTHFKGKIFQIDKQQNKIY